MAAEGENEDLGGKKGKTTKFASFWNTPQTSPPSTVWRKKCNTIYTNDLLCRFFLSNKD